jgi:hypothetical protein
VTVTSALEAAGAAAEEGLLADCPQLVSDIKTAVEASIARASNMVETAAVTGEYYANIGPRANTLRAIGRPKTIAYGIARLSPTRCV